MSTQRIDHWELLSSVAVFFLYLSWQFSSSKTFCKPKMPLRTSGAGSCTYSLQVRLHETGQTTHKLALRRNLLGWTWV
ncbi:hypothetical protein DEU56DRAFT_837792 [Suillus clintonianus]|uniref:uncharacterized protein n=1 Tax=Suillus clintonianus TaxID=1904413 RepID=UPI001B86755C|nr:uncharacterized protein DEU56DRAFT_837792 [Suillus clintonianus]KAG2118482.1 hypothetical protein DEU56DRAFT_837792 [Suillus clintonianus]